MFEPQRKSTRGMRYLYADAFRLRDRKRLDPIYKAMIRAQIARAPKKKLIRCIARAGSGWHARGSTNIRAKLQELIRQFCESLASQNLMAMCLIAAAV